MKDCILVFEDDGDNFNRLADPLRTEINQEKYYIDHFEGDRPSPDNVSDSDFVKQYLEGGRERKDYPLLVILDAELNEYVSSTVRRADVRDACSDLGIPLCVYHRDEGEFANPESIKDSDDQVIQLLPSEKGHSGMATDCAAIIEGFAEIRSNLEERIDDAQDLLEPPSETIKDLDDIPISAKPILDKYSWGQSESIGAISEGEFKEDAIRRKSTILGYWMFNQLLEYPGVLANSVAAASYLGLDDEAFKEQHDIQDLFKKARYKGPFSNLRDWWWITELDSILAKNTTPDDGSTISSREYLSRNNLEVDPVECLEGHQGAGFYCILKEAPVCEEHSVSPEAWIPAGASLTRISESEYLKLSGW